MNNQISERNKSTMFLSSKIIFSEIFILVVSISTVLGADVTISKSINMLVIEINIVRFEYDFSEGQYNAIDRRDNSVCIKDAYFQINDYTTTMSGLEHTSKSKSVSKWI